jgi:predicted esterase
MMISRNRCAPLLVALSLGCSSGSGAHPAIPSGGSTATNAGAAGNGVAGDSNGGAGGNSGGSPAAGAAGNGVAGDSGGVDGNAGGPPAAGGMGGSTSSARFVARPLGSNTAPNGYYEYLPPGYDGSAATPLLVFWNGIGSDGNGKEDLSKVATFGPPALMQVNQWPDSRPFIVLSPQYTATNGNIEVGGGCSSSAIVDAFLTWAISFYKVDPKRVFLTGLSCGAIGSWDYLAEHQGTTVAAAVLMSGNPGDPTQATSTWARAGGCTGLGSVAIWSLHGDADDTVPYAPDEATMELLLACPSPPRRPALFTDVKGGGHNIWDPIYNLSGGYGDIYQWLLDNAKP